MEWTLILQVAARPYPPLVGQGWEGAGNGPGAVPRVRLGTLFGPSGKSWGRILGVQFSWAALAKTHVGWEDRREWRRRFVKEIEDTVMGIDEEMGRQDQTSETLKRIAWTESHT